MIVLSKLVQDAMNEQIKNELFSAYQYLSEPGAYEAIYSNMPKLGLAKAAERAPATGGRETARRRLMREERH